MEWNGAHHDGSRFSAANALDDEQVDPDGRRDFAEFDIHHQDSTESDRIDAITAENRIPQWHRDDDHADAFHEGKRLVSPASPLDLTAAGLSDQAALR